MMNDDAFFGGMPAYGSPLEPGCHRHDPETSYEAARQFSQSGKHATHREIVLDGVRRCDGSTHSEIAKSVRLDWLQVARRLPELARAGSIRRGPARICTIKGSKCCTWWINAALDCPLNAPGKPSEALQSENGAMGGANHG
jgi:hypothetical protein